MILFLDTLLNETMAIRIKNNQINQNTQGGYDIKILYKEYEKQFPKSMNRILEIIDTQLISKAQTNLIINRFIDINYFNITIERVQINNSPYIPSLLNLMNCNIKIKQVQIRNMQILPHLFNQEGGNQLINVQNSTFYISELIFIDSIFQNKG